MSLGHRIALTLFIVLAILFAFALCGYLNNRWEETVQPFTLASAESKPELCMDEQTRELVRNVMIDALDEALRKHVIHMFEVWMKDDRGQPERARNGVLNGIKAYIHARKGVADWTPPPCAN